MSTGLATRAGDSSKVAREVKVDGFSATRSEDGRSLDYRRKGESEVSFRDSGERLRVSREKRTEPGVLNAALKVAATKFTRLSISGSQEFREASAREAVSMGLGERISNPELKAFVKAERDRLREQQAQQGLQQHQAATQGSARSQSTQSAVVKEETPLQEQSTERMQSAALPASSASLQTTAEGRAEGTGTADFPVIRMSGGTGAKAHAVIGTTDMPVTRMSGQGVKGRGVGGTEEMPVSRMSSNSGETISAEQSTGGRGRSM